MVGAYLILLREGFEAALIVGIILAAVARLGAMAYGRHVMAGVGAAVLASLGFAFVADRISELFAGAGQEVMNGAILGIAAAMITYVIVWLRESRRQIDRQLSGKVAEHAVGRGVGLFVLAFVSVFREGAESVLFLWAIVAGGGEDTAGVVIGGIAGLFTAVLIAWLLFQGGRRIPLKTFFDATTVLLVLLAAGMLARAAGYWVAVDWLPALAYGVWDTGHILPDRGGLGGVLAILFGYNANPTLMEVLVFGGYLMTVALWLRFGGRAVGTPASAGG
ncbi:MAG: FTR1 family protein [Nitrospirae bacterium]|nr:FTR1 family protein [Nitrospirota bacterium]